MNAFLLTLTTDPYRAERTIKILNITRNVVKSSLQSIMSPEMKGMFHVTILSNSYNENA